MESGAGGRNSLKKVILRKKTPRETAAILGKAFKLLLGHEFGSIWLTLSYGAERLQPTSRMQKEGDDEKKERVREEEKIGSYVRFKEASGHQSQS